MRPFESLDLGPVGLEERGMSALLASTFAGLFSRRIRRREISPNYDRSSLILSFFEWGLRRDKRFRGPFFDQLIDLLS